MASMQQDTTIDSAKAASMVSIERDQLEQLRAQLKFAQAQITALNFEVARLKRWRFGKSSESLDQQAPLFEAIVADTALEELAAHDQRKGSERDTGETKRRPVRQTLPEALPRIEHRHELADTNCACGQPGVLAALVRARSSP